MNQEIYSHISSIVSMFSGSIHSYFSFKDSIQAEIQHIFEQIYHYFVYLCNYFGHPVDVSKMDKEVLLNLNSLSLYEYIYTSLWKDNFKSLTRSFFKCQILGNQLISSHYFQLEKQQKTMKIEQLIFVHVDKQLQNYTERILDLVNSKLIPILQDPSHKAKFFKPYQ